MALTNRATIDTWQREDTIDFDEETLTDGSKVYSVALSDSKIRFECVDKKQAYKLFDILANVSEIDFA